MNPDLHPADPTQQFVLMDPKNRGTGCGTDAWSTTDPLAEVVDKDKEWNFYENNFA